MPWLYNEDAALKYKLQGLTVTDANNISRPVPVRYRLPEDELATLTYPIIIIEHVGQFPDPAREHRGYIPYGYAPDLSGVTATIQPPPVGFNFGSENYPAWLPQQSAQINAPITQAELITAFENAGSYDPTTTPYFGYFPLPYNFDYQITVYCRKMAGHLQPLMQALATINYLPYHDGFLFVPQDGTKRTMS